MNPAHKTLNRKWDKTCDEKDFEDIFSLYYAPLCAYALKFVQQKEVCEEVVQDIFLRIWEKRQKLNIDNIKAYLYRGVYYHSLHILAHKRIRAKHHKTVSNIRYAHPTPEEGMIMGEFYHAYHIELDNLSANTRKIFLLSRNSSLKNSEIAEQLKISIKTVESHISQALKAFRKRFEEISNE